MERRAITNVLIQGQRLVGVGADLTQHLATGLRVTSAAPRLRQLITDTKPMSSGDRAELTTELVNLGKLAQAAEDSRKRKYENGSYGGGRGGYQNRNNGGYNSNYRNQYNNGNNNRKGGGKETKAAKEDTTVTHNSNNGSNNNRDGGGSRDRY